VFSGLLKQILVLVLPGVPGSWEQVLASLSLISVVGTTEIENLYALSKIINQKQKKNWDGKVLLLLFLLRDNVRFA